MTATLESLKNYPTAYEVALMHNGDVKKVLGFTAQKSRRGTIKTAQAGMNGQNVLDIIGSAADEPFHIKGATLHFGDNWTIGFTGRTQREVISTS